MTYKLSGAEIIHELLHDEVIIANLDTGIYYSIRGSGIIIWPLILAGFTVSAIEDMLKNTYNSISSILPFINKLLEEKLIISTESSSPSLPELSWPESFEIPLIERYDEMKNLLMLDPIHEVDEMGWPQQR